MIKMNKGDIIFVRGKSLKSRIVRLFDKGRFSHVAVCVSEEIILEADFFTKSHMVKFDESKYDDIEVIDLGLSDELRFMVAEIALDYVGKNYDYAQLFGYAVEKVFHCKRNLFNNPNNLICSELVFHILDRIGILDDLQIGSEGEDLTPNQLYDLVKYISINNKKKSC